ncbi:cyclic nucleotide-binding domain protein [Rhodobacteraceae bacterium HTCC2083]|nr:cyclic nucleotide-binding domain protein [Rhodobacteraceae bacterium HTCC2083]
MLSEQYSGPSGIALAKQTMAKNTSINGDHTIVDSLFAEGEIVVFCRGDKIIRQNGLDNDVYFLLAGAVEIVIGKRKHTIREAPNQVGELAAIHLGDARSASVIVSSSEMAALKVPGVSFHKEWLQNGRLQELMQYELSARNRERAAVIAIVEHNNSSQWFTISSGVGMLSGVLCWLLVSTLSWTNDAQVLAASMVGLCTFIFTLLHNPAFFWRRCFGLVLLLMISSLALDRFLSVEAVQGFGSLKFTMTSSSDAAGFWDSARLVIAVLPVLFLCAFMDKKAGS